MFFTLGYFDYPGLSEVNLQKYKPVSHVLNYPTTLMGALPNVYSKQTREVNTS